MDIIIDTVQPLFHRDDAEIQILNPLDMAIGHGDENENVLAMSYEKN